VGLAWRQLEHAGGERAEKLAVVRHEDERAFPKKRIFSNCCMFKFVPIILNLN
jgi:hypothetical protein